MAQIIINNGDSGLTVRNALNSMLTELYAAIIVPIKIPGVSVNAIQALPANVFIEQISIVPVSGSPTIRIGTTPNGTNILADTVISSFQAVLVQSYLASSSNLYITFSAGSGVLNFRIDTLNNYF